MDFKLFCTTLKIFLNSIVPIVSILVGNLVLTEVSDVGHAGVCFNPSTEVQTDT